MKVLIVPALLLSLALPAFAGDLVHHTLSVPGSYVVMLKDDVPFPPALIAQRHGIRPSLVYNSVLKGFAFSGTQAAANALANDPFVLSVHENSVIQISSGGELNPYSPGDSRASL